MNDNEWEKQLSRLTLAKAPVHFAEKGVGLIQAGQAGEQSGPRFLPFALAAALVVSVSVNVFQVVSSQQDARAMQTEQLAQCNTPAAAASPISHDNVDFATTGNELQTFGMC